MSAPMWLRRLKTDVRWFFVQPAKCKLGRHWACDIAERDGGVTRGMCLHCLADTAPVRPRPADPVRAQWMAETKAALDEYLRGEAS